MIPMSSEEPKKERGAIEIIILYSSSVSIVVATDPYGVEGFLDLLIKDMAHPQTLDGIH